MESPLIRILQESCIVELFLTRKNFIQRMAASIAASDAESSIVRIDDEDLSENGSPESDGASVAGVQMTDLQRYETIRSCEQDAVSSIW